MVVGIDSSTLVILVYQTLVSGSVNGSYMYVCIGDKGVLLHDLHQRFAL